MACNWLMMTSSGEDNWLWEFGSAYRQKKKKTKAEQETAQPTAARFKKHFYVPKHTLIHIWRSPQERNLLSQGTKNFNWIELRKTVAMKDPLTSFLLPSLKGQYSPTLSFRPPGERHLEVLRSTTLL